MIQVNELRIGNWIFDPDRELLDGKGGGFRQVSAFSSEDEEIVHHSKTHKDSKSHSGNLISNIQPIPLTPEILEKCGLTPHLLNERDGYWEKDWFILEGINNTGLFFGKMTKVKYLHQLQNLYFALTNKELEVKL